MNEFSVMAQLGILVARPGALIAGALAEAFGPRIGLTVMGLVCLSLCMLALLFARRFRRAAEPGPGPA